MLAACGSASKSAGFPKDFLFGTAIAGFQVDMGCPTLPREQCEDSNSDWYQYVTSPVTLESPVTYLSKQPPSSGAGHWELYESDFDLAAIQLRNNAFRFSLEWSRIFPTATDGLSTYEDLRAAASPAALDHYHAVLSALRARGLEPFVTLNHYTLPLWIHDAIACHQDLASCAARGWVDRERIVREMAKYAGFCAREFGAEVDLWATLNEPMAVVLPAYIFPNSERSNPPAQLLKLHEAQTALVAMIEAHARMYDAVKEGDRQDAGGDRTVARVGVVYNMVPFRPKDSSDAMDVKAAENAYYIWNSVFLNAITKGGLDDDLDGVPTSRPDLAGRTDFIGINYYTRATIEGLPTAILPEFSPLTAFNPASIQPWEDYPRGIYETLMAVKEMGLPALISENGTPDGNDDGTAPKSLVRHLTWVQRAIRDGADVWGYFYWSLLDSYEWNRGMDVPMGLFAVDWHNPMKPRTARQGAAVYARIAASRSIPTDLAALYPAPE